MKSYKILMSIIDNLKSDNFIAAQADCNLLPKCASRNSLYATIGAIDSQPTEQAYKGTKSAALALADRLIGHI